MNTSKKKFFGSHQKSLISEKKGRIALEALLILVVIVLASGTTLALVHYGVLKPKEGAAEVPLLNAEFIPIGREGYLAVKEFGFCERIGKAYECLDEKETFKKPSLVFFRFIVESTTVNGEVMLVENYRVKGPSGEVLLEVDEKNNFYFDVKSRKKTELIYFKDYVIAREDYKPGEYTLELVVENPLLNKKVTLMNKFELV